ENLCVGARPAFREEQMKRGQRTKLDVFEFHELSLAQRQLLKDGTCLFNRRYIHQEDGTFLILARPPLVDLSSEVKTKCSWHLLWKYRLALLRRRRTRESA